MRFGRKAFGFASAGFDEADGALSALVHDLVATGKSQFLIATHLPILMTHPGSQIISFDKVPLSVTTLEQTAHYRVTRGILEQPGSYLKHLTS